MGLREGKRQTQDPKETDFKSRFAFIISNIVQ